MLPFNCIFFFVIHDSFELEGSKGWLSGEGMQGGRKEGDRKKANLWLFFIKTHFLRFMLLLFGSLNKMKNEVMTLAFLEEKELRERGEVIRSKKLK